MNYIQRAEDLQGIIRENELLRLHNKNLTKSIYQVIQKSSETLAYILNTDIQPEPSNQIDNYINNFFSSLQSAGKAYYQSKEEQYKLNTQHQNDKYLSLQEKINQHQATINELSLIIHKLQNEIEQKNFMMDKINLLLLQQQLKVQQLQMAQIKWRSRYQITENELSEHKRQEKMVLEYQIRQIGHSSK